MNYRRPSRNAPHRSGSVLIIVLWVAFGLVTLCIYFANSTSLELRAADNRAAAAQADQAILGAARYISFVLSNAPAPGSLPDPITYHSEGVPVGEAQFWLIGRDTNAALNATPANPYFGLADEASKINLNTATAEMLELLPRMTPELAAAIIDWRDADSNLSPGGAEEETYLRFSPPYKCKNAPFESVDELRLVAGMDSEILYGEDANLNGVLDPEENDGERSPPFDNRDGRLDPGLLDLVTVYSQEPNTRADGSRRINIAGGGQQQLSALLRDSFGPQRSVQILQRVAGGPVRSPLEFFIRSGLSREEFAQIADALSTTNGATVQGLINVNTAGEAVLASIPGIGSENASTLIAYRQSNPDQLASVAWVAEVLDRASALRAGPFLTTRSFQFRADVAAVGHFGRGYRRVRFVFDTADGDSRILYRQDLSHLGWALGAETRQTLAALYSKAAR